MAAFSCGASVCTSIGTPLCVWTCATDSTGGYDLVRYTQQKGVSGRSVDGVLAVQSLLNAATGGLAAKYEDAANTIHKRLHDQQVRESTLEDVYRALCAMNQTTWADTYWSSLNMHLKLDHPLNPAISDAEAAIERLNGVSLHLTSRKRARTEEESDEHDGHNSHESRTHNHSNTSFCAMYNHAIQCAVGAVVTPSKLHVYAKEGYTTPRFLPVAPADIGREASFALFDIDAYKTYYSKDPDAKATYVAESLTDTATLQKLAPVLNQNTPCLSLCSSLLFMPALVAASTGTNVYHKTIDAIQDLVTDVQPYNAVTLVPVTEGQLAIVRLFPANDGVDKYDAIYDFGTEGGWCIGATPSLNTDAAAAAHCYVSSLAT